LATLPELEFSSEKAKSAKNTTSRIQELHDVRNVLAHSFFKPESSGVKFFKAEKSLTADTSRTINDDTFELYRNEMADLWVKLAMITGRVHAKMTQRQIAEAMIRTRFEEDLAPFSKPH
jgi:hypothetical protein